MLTYVIPVLNYMSMVQLLTYYYHLFIVGLIICIYLNELPIVIYLANYIK